MNFENLQIKNDEIDVHNELDRNEMISLLFIEQRAEYMINKIKKVNNNSKIKLVNVPKFNYLINENHLGRLISIQCSVININT